MLTEGNFLSCSKSISDDCDVAANGNTGCGVQSSVANSYGKSFNTAGGGFYAMERTTTFIKVWSWSRNDPTVPADVKTAGATVDTDAWVRIALLSPPGTSLLGALHTASLGSAPPSDASLSRRRSEAQN